MNDEAILLDSQMSKTTFNLLKELLVWGDVTLQKNFNKEGKVIYRVKVCKSGDAPIEGFWQSTICRAISNTHIKVHKEEKSVVIIDGVRYIKDTSSE